MAKPLRGCTSSGASEQISAQVTNVLRCIHEVLEEYKQEYLEDAAQNVRNALKTYAVNKGVSFDVLVRVEYPVELYRAFCILTWPSSGIDPRAVDIVAAGHDLPDALSAPLTGHKGMFLTKRVVVHS